MPVLQTAVTCKAKMTKNSLILIFVFVLSSCCETHIETEYRYNNVTISRIDECGKTTFYYEKDGKRIAGEIRANYSGINDGFAGYLKFDKNGKVYLLSGDGYFQKSNDLNNNLFDYQRIIATERPELNTNVCRIMLGIKTEKERNLKTKSKVKIDHLNNKY